MFQPKQLLVSTFIILLLSCNSTDKQKEQANSTRLKDTIATIAKRAEISPDTTKVIEEKPVDLKARKETKKFLTNSNLQVQPSLGNDFKIIEQAFQDFTINSSFDTTLFGKEGTVLKIKHSSFLIASTLTEAKGAITFQIKEFYKISDILSARLTTHSNDKILETGGMLFIQATFNGQLCKLKANLPIEISFPFAEKKEGMLLFSGNWKNQKINWELFRSNESKQNVVPIISNSSESITIYNEEQSIPDTIFKKEFERTINDTIINEVKTADIRQYIFSTSKLGWINCDRFYNSSKPSTDFYVDCGNYTELDIKLVFHSFKAILDNYASKTAYKFQSIPNNEAITVVVIKKINNDTFISLTESNTSLKSIDNLAFEKVTMSTLKQKLESLNNARWQYSR